ncbi:MAG: menaquinol oxidoreductase [Desulfobacteraceae bacterium 4572_123]|nr:MAG: menaquinol oxidoreductase [Desulfobacteraceae bacterium 4572_123]
MNGKYLFSLIAVIVLFLLAYVGVETAGLQVVFGIIIPYMAVLTFIIGFVYRVMGWARSPVPFPIPTTCGQHKSLPWLKQNKIDNPSGTLGVIARMALEILCFRSLFRNIRMGTNKDGQISYHLEIWLWLSALVFHYSFLVVITRHLRFFTEPVPLPITLIEKLDAFFQVGLPVFYMSGFALLAALLFLLARRLFIAQVKYISLAADFFPLFLLIGITFTGLMMRYLTKTDIVGIKELAMGLATFHPTIPGGISWLFYVHLFFVSTLLIYFPFSKLMHLGGIFLSPTRNLTTDTRARRHVNPWNYPVAVHTYEEYEDEFREKMVEAGLPVDKQSVDQATEEKE